MLLHPAPPTSHPCAHVSDNPCFLSFPSCLCFSRRALDYHPAGTRTSVAGQFDRLDGTLGVPWMSSSGKLALNSSTDTGGQDYLSHEDRGRGEKALLRSLSGGEATGGGGRISFSRGRTVAGRATLSDPPRAPGCPAQRQEMAAG